MAVKALASRGRGVASTAQSLQGEEVLMLSVRANDRGATPVGDVEVESRIRGNVYVRFGKGCDPFSRNLESSKGMGDEGSLNL